MVFTGTPRELVAQRAGLTGVHLADVRDALPEALVTASREACGRTMAAQIEAGNTASIHLHAKADIELVGTIPAAGDTHGRILDLTLMTLRL